MPKPAHYRGDYHVRARRVRARAWADPTTRCWRCHLTIDGVRVEHPRAFWTAGHLVDGEVGGPLAPECSPCNFRAGQERGRRPKHTSSAW